MIDGVTYLDVETTGLYPTLDKVVQVSVANGDKKLTLLLNPQQVIPQEAINVHGITNEAVSNQPTFKDVHQSLMPFFDTNICKYICGYNVPFDFKFIQMEFSKCGLLIDSSKYKFLDPLAIHRRLCPNDLASMYRRYTKKELVGGHDAEVDREACLEILQIQHTKTGKSIEELSELSGLSNMTIGGWLEPSSSGYKFLRGKHQGRSLIDTLNIDRGYLEWVVSVKDISFEEQLIVKQALGA